ncbi:threo-3-hydroxy-L-aspartate ammonia-lyase [Thermosynechococcaceae cyanobacterium BACA0444]|uniref:threonine ammonia-lyase n=2 Tax=Pseudocalidococcus TaxID=3110321 RepID=A0AAE4FS78_9CYAN|nr:threo-3-hydroxy-L-aspartate ammonia-lyase [Pseudocalidococcus azoricus BACA0444]
MAPISKAVTAADILQASHRLQSIAHHTPVITSQTVDTLTQAQVFFKCENFQRTGSFKFRGAYNALCQLTDSQQQQGVLTYSSGNHAQALALAGKLLGIPITIVMPTDAPAVKLAATQQYGAEIILYDRNQTTRESLGQQLARERNLTIIPPYDHPHVIAGQGTTALELLQSVDALDVVLICCGGGGLLSGCAIALKEFVPTCRVIGVEPKLADDATRSFYSGQLQTVLNPPTIADGARTPSLGTYTFPIVLETVDQMLTVSEAVIVQAWRFLGTYLKLVVEPTGALATAALLELATSGAWAGQRIGVILSGGNVDLSDWFGRNSLS